ncbi:hypothetical protein ANCCAN_18380 [Ancylostoma caninum]|uniref:Sugar phosphate transporter domain-containing protein n=1 Tax=Ancylostoma caninum TaxID=29170 RepID=A0A368FU70_ANCCA|nr:hypothetical protein ANCCAN_18380 [Ancylostoma caninum]
MGSRGPVFALIVCVMMVVTGSLNTICAKWADRIHADGIPFNHPFLQAGCMFFGELLCMGAYMIQFGYRHYRWSKQKNPGVYGILIQEEPKLPRFNPFVFLPPAICDIIGTSVMYIGLNLTTASSYQMLRGALIVCTGLLSIFMVGAKIPGFKWMGMLLVVLGLVVVGVTDILCGDHIEHSKQDIIVGDVLCVVAQVFVALQLVLEQKYMAKYDVEPLFAVGLEGIYGLVLLIIALVPLYYIHVPPVFSTNPQGRLEDLFYAWKQINMEPMIAVALSGTTISIAFFNYAGVSVTKELSATTRTVIDSIRTIVIWAASIPLFHAKFIPYQIIGFVLLLMGMFIYNDIIFGPWVRFKFLPEKEPESMGCTW